MFINIAQDYLQYNTHKYGKDGETYSQPSKTSNIELFAKINKG